MEWVYNATVCDYFADLDFALKIYKFYQQNIENICMRDIITHYSKYVKIIYSEWKYVTRFIRNLTCDLTIIECHSADSWNLYYFCINIW